MKKVIFWMYFIVVHIVLAASLLYILSIQRPLPVPQILDQLPPSLAGIQLISKAISCPVEYRHRELVVVCKGVAMPLPMEVSFIAFWGEKFEHKGENSCLFKSITDWECRIIKAEVNSQKTPEPDPNYCRFWTATRFDRPQNELYFIIHCDWWQGLSMGGFADAKFYE